MIYWPLEGPNYYNQETGKGPANSTMKLDSLGGIDVSKAEHQFKKEGEK